MGSDAIQQQLLTCSIAQSAPQSMDYAGSQQVAPSLDMLSMAAGDQMDQICQRVYSCDKYEHQAWTEWTQACAQ